MKRSIVFLVVILYLTGGAAYTQSLGDLAKKELERRNSIPADKTITIELASATVPNEEVLTEDAENGDDYDETENPNNIDVEETVKASEYPAGKTDPDGLTDLNGRPESYWRTTMSDVRNRLNQLEEEAKELTSRRNALQLQHDRTNGAQRGPIKDEIDRTRLEQDLNRNSLEETRKELQSLQNEARLSGALPGWIE